MLDTSNMASLTISVWTRRECNSCSGWRSRYFDINWSLVSAVDPWRRVSRPSWSFSCTSHAPMEPHRLGALLPGSLPLRLTARQLTPDWCFGRTDLLPPLPLACLITPRIFLLLRLAPWSFQQTLQCMRDAIVNCKKCCLLSSAPYHLSVRLTDEWAYWFSRENSTVYLIESPVMLSTTTLRPRPGLETYLLCINLPVTNCAAMWQVQTYRVHIGVVRPVSASSMSETSLTHRQNCRNPGK